MNPDLRFSDFRDLKVTVMGLGVNQGGLGVSKWLLRRGARLVVTDLKDQHALAESIAELERSYLRLVRVHGKSRIHRVEYVLGMHRERDFRETDLVIQNPGVPRESKYLKIARKAGVPIESDMSIFFRLCPHPIVGVSGTKGKTTVTALTGAMLERAYGKAFVAGNIRKSPLAGYVMEIRKRIPIVLELSSWQLESLKAARRSPEVAVLTNVLPDHLNRYDGMKDYAAAKELIYAWQEPGDIAIVPRDNAYTQKMGEHVGGARVWASMKLASGDDHALGYRGATAALRWKGKEIALFRAYEVPIPGAHNLWNALLAAGTSYLRGASVAAIRKALTGFKGVPHRLERVGDVRGVAYWNDTAATTPEASVAAMETLFAKKKGVLLAGGADKELVFGAWAKVVAKRCKEVILFEGSATPKMLAALKKAKANIGDVVSTMTSAVLHAGRAAKRGETVLLSPGCASFGLFVNEFDRGDKFREAVRRLRRRI